MWLFAYVYSVHTHVFIQIVCNPKIQKTKNKIIYKRTRQLINSVVYEADEDKIHSWMHYFIFTLRRYKYMYCFFTIIKRYYPAACIAVNIWINFTSTYWLYRTFVIVPMPERVETRALHIQYILIHFQPWALSLFVVSTITTTTALASECVYKCVHVDNRV